MAVLTAVFPVVQVHAEDTRKTIRVGYFKNGDYMHKNDAGDYVGYDVEYYYTLAQYANWDIQFIDYDSLSDAETALENHEIDILSGLSKSTAREEKFLFSASRFCTAAISVQVREDDDRFSLSNTASLEELNCGIVNGSVIISLYTNWCDVQGITPHITLFNNTAERDEALQNGTVNAVAGSSTIQGAQKIAEFSSTDLYFVLNKEDKQFKLELDHAMSVLLMENTEFNSDLYEKYFPASRNTSPSFSKEEKQYLSDHPTIYVGMLKNYEPYSYEENGKLEGFLPEYIDRLSGLTGVTFVSKGYDDIGSMYTALQNGQIDIIGKTLKDAEYAYMNGAVLTNAYISANLVQITRSGDDEVVKAAVTPYNKDFISNVLKENQMDVELLEYSNDEACINALHNKEVDAVYFSQPAASYYRNRSRANDYVLTTFSGYEMNICMSVNMGTEGSLLRSILNETMAVDKNGFNQIVSTDLMQDTSSLKTIVNRMTVSTIITLSALAVAILLIVIFALFIILRRRNAEKKLALEQAQVAADQERNKARHTFFGAVSHDMRTPLNGIMGFTDLALKSEDPHEIKTYLNKIHTSGETLSLLVNDTLLMSRLENNQYILTPSPTDLNDLIQGVLLPMYETAKASNVTLIDHASKKCTGWYQIDKISLQKVLLNLLANAIKFSNANTAVIFSCSRRQNTFTFTVSDQGVGMNPEFQKHMFEPFSQEDYVKSKVNGTGLGLAIVKSIVDAMHGTITVDSKKDIGTVFTVQLELEPCAAPVETNQVSEKKLDCLKDKHVLICEDNELNMEIEATILKNAGMIVTSAPDGKQGLDAFLESETGYYDFILMDLRMPVMDGLTAAKKIREAKRDDAGTVLIYAVSADAFQENISEAANSGMNGHIAKPINAQILLQTLCKEMKERDLS